MEKSLNLLKLAYFRLGIIMLNIFMYHNRPQFFSIGVENSVDFDQMASLEAS